MEERSLKKGFDITLFEESTKELWFAEVKSGSIHQDQKNAAMLEKVSSLWRNFKFPKNLKNELFLRVE